MRIFLILLACILFLTNCNGKHTKSGFYNKPIITISDSIKNRKVVASEMAKSERSESEEETLSFKEVLADQLASYNKVEKINKLVIDGKDTLQLHETYYCLHDSSLIIPKHYLWGGDTTKDFVTHNFAAKVVVMKNKDTVLNKIFTRADFNNVIQNQLKKYAIIFDPEYSGYDKAKGEFALGVSISIPLTDVGVPAYLAIDKKGNYKILDEYAKMDRFKKN